MIHADWKNYIISDAALKERSRTLQFWPFLEAASALSQELNRPVSLLDCGCACGHLAKMLDQHGIRHDYVGLDYDADLLRLGREHYEQKKLAQGDIRALPFKEKHFDVVVAYDILYLMENQEAVLKELVRVARYLLAVETHHAPCGSNSLKMRMHSRHSYTRLDNLQHAPELYKASNLPEPDWTVLWEVPSTYFKYLGLPYRIRNLSLWRLPPPSTQRGAEC